MWVPVFNPYRTITVTYTVAVKKSSRSVCVQRSFYSVSVSVPYYAISPYYGCWFSNYCRLGYMHLVKLIFCQN